MTIYVLGTTEGAETLRVHDRDASRFLRENLVGRPLADEWPEIRVSITRSDDLHKNRTPSDFPRLHGGALVLRVEALDIVGPFLEGQAEVLPLVCDDAELRLVNVTRLVAGALDIEGSDVLRASDGRVLNVRSYAFHADVVDNVQIFKIPEELRVPILLNDAFVESVTASGLRGITFRRVWSSADTRVSS